LYLLFPYKVNSYLTTRNVFNYSLTIRFETSTVALFRISNANDEAATDQKPINNSFAVTFGSQELALFSP
jgi:hypothetical protein